MNHGINGKDCLVLKQADVTVTSGGDALRATNDSDTTLGCVLIGASALTLTAGEDGIQAETTLTLFDTTGTVTSGEPTVTDICPVPGVTEAELLGAACALEQKSEHPLAKAVLRRAAAAAPAPAPKTLQFGGIVRNRLKITAAIANARLFIAIQQEFGSFYNYVLSFFPDRQPVVHHFRRLEQVPATSAEADALSGDMKKRGFKFFGPTICYAFLQATGFVNDHLEGCRCKVPDRPLPDRRAEADSRRTVGDGSDDSR